MSRPKIILLCLLLIIPFQSFASEYGPKKVERVETQESQKKGFWKKHSGKILKGTLAAIVLTSVTLLLREALKPKYNIPDAKTLKKGDLIGTTLLGNDQLGKMFELATLSRYSHIGVIDKDDTGKIYVYHATPANKELKSKGLRRDSFEEFLRTEAHQDPKTGKYEYSIVRKEGLTQEQVDKVMRYARDHIDTPYNHIFRTNQKGDSSYENAMCCSEFVCKAFKAGTEKELGKEEKMKDLPLLQEYPHFGEALKQQYRILYRDDFEVITPESIMLDPQVTPIYEGLPLKRVTPQEIETAWMDSP